MQTFAGVRYAISFGILIAVGLIDESWMRARAFDRVQDRLFQLPWVKAIAVRGFGKSPGPSHVPEDKILVLTDRSLTTELQEEVDEIVKRINDRFGVRMRSVVMNRISSIGAE